MCFENGLPRQSADCLAMTGFSTALPLPLGEVAERSEDGEGKQKRTASGRFFSLSINLLYGVSGSFTQGELEGAKPASNQIKCRAKPCLARRAWSEATIFVPQGGTKITTLFQAVERAKGFFDSLRETAFGRFSLCAKSALHEVLTDGKHAPLSILTENVSPAEKQQARLRRSPRRSVKLCVRRGQKSNG